MDAKASMPKHPWTRPMILHLLSSLSKKPNQIIKSLLCHLCFFFFFYCRCSRLVMNLFRGGSELESCHDSDCSAGLA